MLCAILAMVSDLDVLVLIVVYKSRKQTVGKGVSLHCLKLY